MATSAGAFRSGNASATATTQQTPTWVTPDPAPGIGMVPSPGMPYVMVHNSIIANNGFGLNCGAVSGIGFAGKSIVGDSSCGSPSEALIVGDPMLAQTGLTTVTGTVMCSRAGDQFGVVVDLEQTQKVGKNTTPGARERERWDHLLDDGAVLERQHLEDHQGR